MVAAKIETNARRPRRLLRWFLVADLCILASGLVAFYVLTGSESRLDATLKWTAEEVSSAVAGALDGGYSVETARSIAEIAEPVLFRLARLGGDTPVMAHRRGWINVQLSRAYGEIGDAAKQRQFAEAGKRAFERAAALEPGNPEWKRDLAAVEDDIGNALAASGDLDGALRHHLEGKRLVEALLAQDPGNPRLKGDVAASLGKLGRHYMGRGRHAEGRQHLIEGRRIIVELLADDPTNSRWQGYRRVFDRMLGEQTGDASLSSASRPPRL
jgi:tetratricopeptide (TPR) repeat protein